MLIQTITPYSFRDAFIRADRGTNFSYEALNLLFDYFDDDEEPTEFDVIKICCEWAEMTEDEVREYYTIDEGEDVEEYLQGRTIYLGTTGNPNPSFVFMQF